MFSENFDPSIVLGLLEMMPPNIEVVEEILNADQLTLQQLTQLVLSAENIEARELVVAKAEELRSANWGYSLFLMPPLYISSGNPLKGGCADFCLYCPWRHDNVPAEKLLRLTPDEVQNEAEYLIGLGYGDIELVSATDPELLKAENAAKMVQATKDAGAMNIGINFFPLKDVDAYRTVSQAGATYAIVWQETYHQPTYERMHPKGPKANMAYRLDAHDRAIQGGIGTVGLAFLGGLADWRFDVLATILHALYLQSEYAPNLIFGMPRWKGDGQSTNITSCDYGDDLYRFVGALYSIAFPQSLPWFSTREAFELSSNCVSGGGCMFTLDCSTEVGGYTSTDGFAQFPVHTKSFSEGVEWLKNLGFKPKIHLPW